MLLGSPVSRPYVLYMFEQGINLVELTLLLAGSRAPYSYSVSVKDNSYLKSQFMVLSLSKTYL